MSTVIWTILAVCAMLVAFGAVVAVVVVGVRLLERALGRPHGERS